tara:strand:- start:1580 stop:1966 length:387 start_codon:yes stop_codon:yes gene_type:complete
MIDSKLLKIASNTRFYGLKNNYTYKTNLKNSTCGDKISIEIILKKNTIKELRYETEACIFCQASASTLANIAKNTNFSNLKINLSKYLNLSKKVPKKFNNLTYLLNEKYMNRKDCILLPFKAFYKAIK